MELAPIETTQVDSQADAWFASYVDPSKDLAALRRRARHRRHRSPSRSQVRRRSTLMMLASFAFVGVMTACFYLVLTR